MSATPLFLVTDAGLAVASQAKPEGPFIHITKFAIGSAFGYKPQRSDTGLNGTKLFDAAPSSYEYIGDNTINIICRIPPDAGPFDFGEVAVYLDDGTMFAKAVFDTLQTKFSSLGTNLLSTYTFNCLIKLEQAVAVFKIDTESGIPPAIWEVDLWSDIFPSGLSANPDIPSIIVHEATPTLHNSSFVIKATDAKWTISSGYTFYHQATIVNGSTTSVQCAASDLTPLVLSEVNRRYVIEIDGYFRSVLSVEVAGANYVFTLNPAPLLTIPALGDTFTIYIDTEDSAPQPITQPQFDANEHLIATDLFVQRALGSLSGVAPITGNVNLTAAAAGRLQEFNATSTANLPLGSTVVPGVCVFFRAAADNNVVGVQGPDQIMLGVNVVASVSVLQADGIGFCWDGSHWVCFDGVASILNSKSFINSYNALAAQILTPLGDQGPTRTTGGGDTVAASGYEVYQIGNQFQVRLFQVLTNCNCNCNCACTCVF